MRTVPILTLLLATTSLIAQTPGIEWQTLSRYQGSGLRMIMNDGTQVRGRLERADIGGVSLAGRAGMIPPTDLKSMEVSRPTKKWRIVGMVAGVVVGISAAVVTDIAVNGILPNLGSDHHGDAAAPIAVGVGVAVTGYLIGWRADRRWIPVTLRPAAQIAGESQ